VTQPQRLVAVFIGLSILLEDQSVHACPVCFRVDDAATTSGVYAAVFVLLGVTGGVLGGVAAFIVRFARRARHQAATESDTSS